MVRKLSLALAIVFSLSVISVSVYAGNTSSLQQQKASVDSRINKIASEKKKVLEQKKQLESKQKSIAEQQASEKKTYNEIVSNLEILKANLKEIEASLAIAEENFRQQEELFKTRMKVMYQNSNVSLFDTFVESESILDFLERLHYMSLVAKKDRELIEDLKAAREEVEHKKRLKEAAKRELERRQLESQQKIATLNASRSEIDQSISKTNKELAQLEKEEDALIAKSRELSETIKKLTKQSGSSSKKYAGGSMVWPCPSSYNITSYFGNRKHPILRKYKFHSGIDIAASSGSSIVAANSGTVIISAYNSGGYGNYIVIDHGGGITTLYAHASKRLVSVGDKVKAGQVIAKVGSTGLSTGPHLHFEVRVDGNPVNPLKGYLSN